jgi:putative ABC transport system substrate-binding protein
MRRREFLGGISSVAAWPVVARAQQPMPVIGFLSSRTASDTEYLVKAFRNGLGERGFVEGQNLRIVFRWADGQYDRLPVLAAELVTLGVDILFAAGGPPSALAAKAATPKIPIVFSAVSDPVRNGLVASLNRPGGNVTGMSNFAVPLGAKGIELLKELVPNAKVMAYLANPSNSTWSIGFKDTETAATALGVRLQAVNASSVPELDTAFSSLAALRVDCLFVNAEPFFDSQRERIVTLAAHHGIVSGYAWRENIAAGGLISYGTSLTESYRQAALYVARILKGEMPGDLPVMQPTKFEMAINLKTARNLGITVPPTLLARADEVIE